MSDAPSSAAGPAAWWWVVLPRRLSPRFPGLGVITADGHVLAGLGAVGAVLPPLALLSGAAVGVVHPGFDVTFTEVLPIMLGALCLGMISTQLGAAFVVGFAVGDLLLAHTSWTAEVNTFRVEGVLANPVVANLVLERVPLLIQYTLLAALAVAVPLGARSLAASVASRLRLPEAVHLWVTAVLVAITAFVLARFWASAAPVVIRPVFTWTPDGGINGASPPVGAIAPIQENEAWITRTAVVAVLARAALTWWVPSSETRRARVRAVEDQLLAPIDGTRPTRGLVGSLWLSAVYAVSAVLLLAGIFTDLWVAAVLAVVMFASRLLKLGVVPLPTRRWREVVGRVPVVVRFGLAVLVVNGVAKALIDSSLNDGDSFQFMAWPVAAGALLLAVFVPDTAPAPERRSGGAASLAVLAVLGGVALVLASPEPAAADNCGSFNDCFFTADAGSTALLGLVFLTALSLAIDFSRLGRIRGGIEAVTGRDILTGAELSAAERLLGIIPGGRAARGLDAIDDAVGAGRGIRNAVGSTPPRPRGGGGAPPPRGGGPPGGGGGRPPGGGPPGGGRGGGGRGGDGGEPPEGPRRPGGDGGDADRAMGDLTRGGGAKASDLVGFGESQGWTRTQTENGPIKFVDENGVTRLTIKSGSPRAPGSAHPHVEMRNADGQRIDPDGNLVTRKSPGNHTPIDWDLP